MSNPSALGAIVYEAESAWAEDVPTFATHRVPVIGEVNVSGLAHDKEESGRTEQYRTAGSQHVLMTMGGSFSTKIDLCGHGVTTAGSPTLDAIENWLALAFGNAALSATASDTVVAGTAAIPTTTGASGVSAGGLVRVGVLGDGNGDGQFYPVSTHGSNNLNLISALIGAPTASDVVYPVAMIYPDSGPTDTAITGTRFLLQSGNLQYACHGCYPMSVSLSGLNTGERPQIEITWGVSRWAYSTATFPGVVASNQYNPAPVAAGSFCTNAIGTTTRSAFAVRGFSLDYTLGIIPVTAPGGVGAYQKTTGAVRSPDAIKISFTVDADATTLTPVWPGLATGAVSRYLIYTLSTAAGSAVCLWFPKICISNVPVQTSVDGISRLTVEASAYCGDTLTSDLTRAPMVIGFA